MPTHRAVGVLIMLAECGGRIDGKVQTQGKILESRGVRRSWKVGGVPRLDQLGRGSATQSSLRQDRCPERCPGQEGAALQWLHLGKPRNQPAHSGQRLLSPCRTHLEPEEGGLVANLVTTGRPRFGMGMWLRKS